MSKFKVGDRVKLVVNDCFEASRGDEVTVTDVINEVIHFKAANGRECEHSEEYFELIGGTMNVGDILVNKDRLYTRTVQGIVGNCVMSTRSDWDIEEIKSWTLAQFQKDGWTVKGDEPVVTEKTVAEIEQEMNLQPGSLRIKKED